ncbi:MAG: hypothetical protein GF350_11545 [Chitinivibrionales bacterium]|nr:hypothetical protein [Chitinivibrionales bacterium]
MKSSDIVTLCKLHVLESEGTLRWTYAQLAESVCMSVGETHASVTRLKEAHLFDDFTGKVISQAMLEFLVHGVRYAFPVTAGPRERGIPTAHSSPFMRNEIEFAEDDLFVWPFAKGSVKGFAIKPLSRNAPAAALKDNKLYELLSLVDSLRVGKVREREYAKKSLQQIIIRTEEHAGPK